MITAPWLLRGAVWRRRGWIFPSSTTECSSCLHSYCTRALAAGWAVSWQPFSFACAIPQIFLFKSRLVPASAQSSAAEAVSDGTGGKGTGGVKLAQELVSPGLPLRPFSSHHSQSREDSSDRAFLVQKVSACWSRIRLGLAGFPYLGAGYEHRC